MLRESKGKTLMKPSSFAFGERGCSLIFEPCGASLALKQLHGEKRAWLAVSQPSSLAGVQVNGKRFTVEALKFLGRESEQPTPGVWQDVLSFEGEGWELQQVIRRYDGFPLVELEPRLINRGNVEIVVERLDSLDLRLPFSGLTLLGYSGNWGSEFEPLQFKPYQPFVLESRFGRSSKGHHPWMAMLSDEGEILAVSIAWSGNWVMRFDPLGGQILHFTAGLHDWLFSKRLQPNESFRGAPLVLVTGEDLNAVSRHLARVGRRYWYPQNELSCRLPVEWNHWWPYEDVEINEEVFLANVHKAAELGFEVCTLDAGWFGPAEAGTFWYDYRGDWHLVNSARFPHGIRYLADRVHALGMKFGIWCEIEALGEKARLAVERPDLPALRDGNRLGYVCMGNPAAREWAYQTLSRLILEWGCDWIKLDFNLDPGAGCNRTDHGHQEGDGLYEHYRGYYQVLTRIRRDFPHVVLENCSSGGLRIDLGMMRQTHVTFLSDPDWAVHDLQIFWGASTMLAPNVLLHWTFSHWRNVDPPPQQRFNPHDPHLTRQKWDYYSRISMLGWYGLSQKLPDLPGWLAERVAYHNRLYQTEIRRFIREGDLYRLSAQPLRSGIGERWAVFQYAMPDESEHLLFIFRLPGGEPSYILRPVGLQPERLYRVYGFEGEGEWHLSGRDLMEKGLSIDCLQEEESLLLKME